MIKKISTLVVCFIFIFSGFSIAQDIDYIGAGKCKMCHNKSTTGKQYDVWLKGPHANALKTLSSEKSLAYAKEKGIADPSKEAKCLKCHSTYHSDSEDLMLTIKETEGVSCESCHGAGNKYKSMSVMKSQEKSLANGLIIPNEEVCLKCHIEEGNDFYKPFVYEEAVKKIAHPNPAAQ